MNSGSPSVSVIITTYNRSALLRRAVDSVLRQDFTDFEIIIVDDCSTDDTQATVKSYGDPRIRYFRNESNVGSKHGDRAILRRLIYDLAQGRYFVYLCDDDYWLFDDMLSRQVKAFSENKNVMMVIGGQLSHFLTSPESYLGGSPSDPFTLTRQNADTYFDFQALKSKTPHLSFMRADGAGSPLFPKTCMTSAEFLVDFAAAPTTKNLIVGATLYDRDGFVRSGALKSTEGSRWQAGYELLMGPACYGNVVYFDRPTVVTEIRQANASFQRTQAEHYRDSIKSIEIAFQAPLMDMTLRTRWPFLKKIKKAAIHNLSRLYLVNTMVILRDGALTLCSDDNISDPVTMRHVLPVLIRNQIWPGRSLVRIGLFVTWKRFLRRRL
jgi:glycosyltransferase involved in cell wall biosynthesis